MKKITTTIFVLFICLSNAQIKINLNAKYSEASVTFTDGHTEDGYIIGFIENRFFEFKPISFNISIENQLNLSDNSFTFKNTLEGEKRNLSQNDLVEITVKNDDEKVEKSTTWKLMNLKTVNVKGEIIELHKKAWLPIYKERSSINLFAISIFVDDKYKFSLMYLNNPKDNFAINPLDFNRINIFNMGKIDDKFLFALREVGKDCPNLLKELEGNPDDVLKKYFKSKEERKQDEKEFEESLKDLNRKERKKLEMEYKESEYLYPYNEIVKDFRKFCKN